jgi:Bacteriophage tail sheath protein
MPMNYLTPGVYIEEAPSGARPIQAVGTSTAAFIGQAPDPKAPLNKPLACNNWTDFVKKFAANQNPKSTPLSHAVYGFFLNGGSRCWVVAIGKDDPLSGGQKPAGLDLLEVYDEVAIVAAPGYNDPGAFQDLLNHCEKMGDRVAILDGPEQVEDITRLTQVAMVGEGEAQGGFGPPRQERGFGAFYYPWIKVRDPFESKESVNVPPSGHIAGIWASTDTNPGVHKAPANVIVKGAVGLPHILTPQEQGVLNPEGVNVIRQFSSQGIVVWGARTVAPGSSEWRYLNVRRLFNMIEESIAESTRWIVFEPNDRSLWKSIRRDVNAFLTRVWRSGALMGRTPEEAFFVKCDEETNPPEDIDAGIVTIVIGIAPVKPAEFVVFRIAQKESGAEVEETA